MQTNLSHKITLIALGTLLLCTFLSEKALTHTLNEKARSQPHIKQLDTSFSSDFLSKDNRISRSMSVAFWRGDPRNIAAAFCKQQMGVMKDFDGFNFRCGSQMRYGWGNALDTYSNVSDACTTFFYINRRLKARSGKTATIIASDGWENNGCEGTVEVD
jgi:hypothetical protein